MLMIVIFILNIPISTKMIHITFVFNLIHSNFLYFKSIKNLDDVCFEIRLNYTLNNLVKKSLLILSS